jgi:hypothetical protein
MARRGRPLLAAAIALGSAALCLRTLLGTSGYILQVDIGFGPQAPRLRPDTHLAIDAVQSGLTQLLGGAITGRIYLVVALAVCSLGPMVLLRKAPLPAMAIGGLLGVFNPWTYDRLMEGQWAVAAAAGVLFVWVAAWEALGQRPSIARAFALAVPTAIAVMLDPHAIADVVVLVVVASIASRIWTDAGRARMAGLAMAVAAVVLLPGVIGFFAGGGVGSFNSLARVSETDFTTFAVAGGPGLGVVVNLLSLHGFWAEQVGRFPSPGAGFPLWWVSAAVILGATFAGWRYCPQRRWLAGAGVVGLVLSASTAVPGVPHLAAAIAAHVPLVGAFREPDKLSALWLIAVVALSAGAVEVLVEGARAATRAWAAAGVLAIAVMVPTGIAQMAHLPGRVAPVSYPSDWAVVSEAMRTHVPPGARVVVLPWHQYETLAFAGGRLVANPAPNFFPGELVSSEDPELTGTRPSDPIGVASADLSSSCSLATAVASAGASWVVVEDAPGGGAAAAALRRCGFSVVAGGPGRTSLMFRRAGQPISPREWTGPRDSA